MAEYILTEIEEGIDKDAVAQELIRKLKVTDINLKTLHRNLTGGETNWYQMHDMLNQYHWRICDFEDMIVENLLGLGIKDKSIKGSEDILDCIPYTISEAFQLVKAMFDELLQLSSTLREVMELPTAVLPVFDNLEGFLHIETNYKITQALGGVTNVQNN